jgi:hypothetical protein
MEPVTPAEWIVANFLVLFALCVGGGFAIIGIVAAVDKVLQKMKQRRYRLARKP